jgi:hypothetical protein
MQRRISERVLSGCMHDWAIQHNCWRAGPRASQDGMQVQGLSISCTTILRASYLSRRRMRRIHAVASFHRGLTRSGRASPMQTLIQWVFGHEKEEERPSRCGQDDSNSR